MRKYVDKMITLAKCGTLHARRQALAYVYDKELVKNVFLEVPGRYELEFGTVVLSSVISELNSLDRYLYHMGGHQQQNL